MRNPVSPNIALNQDQLRELCEFVTDKRPVLVRVLRPRCLSASVVGKLHQALHNQTVRNKL